MLFVKFPPWGRENTERGFALRAKQELTQSSLFAFHNKSGLAEITRGKNMRD
jgi:hypothetical protein